MNYLKTYRLFENLVFPTDKREIERICYQYEIKNYSIDADGTVDVDGDVILSHRGLTRLPLKFGKVTRSFFCGKNKLTTLEGSPEEVGVNFFCDNNQLYSLVGGPKKVSKSYVCIVNKLTTLEGAPSLIGDVFWLNVNQITNLDGLPYVGGKLLFERNPAWIFMQIFQNKERLYKSLEYKYFAGENRIHESRFVRACDDLGVTAPANIEGYVWV